MPNRYHEPDRWVGPKKATLEPVKSASWYACWWRVDGRRLPNGRLRQRSTRYESREDAEARLAATLSIEPMMTGMVEPSELPPQIHKT